MPEKPTKVLRPIASATDPNAADFEFSVREELTKVYLFDESSRSDLGSKIKRIPLLPVLPAECQECGRSSMSIRGEIHGFEVSRSLRRLMQPFPDPTGASQPEEDAIQERYLLGEVIGQGGMGAVHRGWDLQLQRCVAIKILSEDQRGHPSSLMRFLREARIASRLLHPGIVKIHEVDIDASGTAFIVMDLLTGQTLDTILVTVRNDPTQIPSLIVTFLQIAQAIAYAHANGVVHRDLKPSNIMVGRYGVVVVLDWGLAKTLTDERPCKSGLGAGSECADTYPELPNPLGDPIAELEYQDPLNTGHGTVMGTPYYLAPEQARGEEVDFRADVFALGGMLCEILTGKPPFLGKNISEVYEQSVSGDLTGAFERLDQCTAPGPMVLLAKRCLAPDPQNRPADASHVVEPLKVYLESGQRRAEEELVRFFELSLDLFCIANTQGYFCRVNDNFPNALGFTAEQLTSCQFIEFVHPDDREKTQAEVERLARGEPTIRFRNRYRHRDGHYLWLEWMARSIESEGRIYAVARILAERFDDPVEAASTL